jgi:hypothetical protein
MDIIASSYLHYGPQFFFLSGDAKKPAQLAKFRMHQKSERAGDLTEMIKYLALSFPLLPLSFLLCTLVRIFGCTSLCRCGIRRPTPSIGGIGRTAIVPPYRAPGKARHERIWLRCRG